MDDPGESSMPSIGAFSATGMVSHPRTTTTDMQAQQNYDQDQRHNHDHDLSTNHNHVDPTTATMEAMEGLAKQWRDWPRKFEKEGSIQLGEVRQSTRKLENVRQS